MAKSGRKSNANRRGQSTDNSSKSPTNESAAEGPKDGLRETIEAIVMAFLLAFLFRSFEAEAFVIPTGSMAPTLYGRHKEITCDECGHVYPVGASGEITKTGAYFPPSRVLSSTCPNCRHEMSIADWPVYNGDRILVNKFTYELGEPDRFDVLVFKYPEEPSTNYIKRLVGLPGESIRIYQGDVYARTADDQPWGILRKTDPDKQRAIQIGVYDDTTPPETLIEQGWPERWAAMERRNAVETDDDLPWRDIEPTDATTGWMADRDTRTYRIEPGDGPAWLRYRHYVPEVWEEPGEVLGGSDPSPSLISDFCAYNTGRSLASQRSNPGSGFFWVGDLTLNAAVKITEVNDGAELLLELVEGSRWYHCRIDPRTGDAELSYVDWELVLDDSEQPDRQVIATSKTRVRGPGTYRLVFANVDDRLCLWVDDFLIDFEATVGEGSVAGTYPSPALNLPTDDDLMPCGIACKNLGATVSDLLIQRDIYYLGDQDCAGQADCREREFSGNLMELAEKLSDPSAWSRYYQEHNDPNGLVFETLGPEEFFVLGDNSPASQDSRLWPNSRRRERRFSVPRKALVGKAFYVFWPHGVPFLNDGWGIPARYHPDPRNPRSYPSLRLPFYPYLSRMRRIR